MGGFSQKVLAAIAQAERDFAQQEEIRRGRSAEKRALSQDELNRQNVLAQLYGKTAKGGQVSVDGQQVDIPGLEAQTAMETAAAQKKAEATARGQFNVQLEFADKLDERIIAKVKSKLEAVGLRPDSPEYNRRLSQQLGLPEEIEVELNGQKVKLPVKEAVDLQQKKLDYDRALAVADRQAAATTEAARIRAQATRDAKADRPATESERRAYGFYNRARGATEDAEKLEDKIVKLGLAGQTRLRLAPNILQSETGQLYLQAQRAFTEARLRKDSGAAIPAFEYENDARTYFAQPGDTKETLAQKRRARINLLKSLYKEAGKAVEGETDPETLFGIKDGEDDVDKLPPLPTV